MQEKRTGPRGKFQPYFSDHLNFLLESDGKQPKKEAVCRLFMEQWLHRSTFFPPTGVSRPQLLHKHVGLCCVRWKQASSFPTARRRAGGGCLQPAFSLGSPLSWRLGTRALCGLLTVVFLPRSSGTRSAGASWCAGASRATSRPWTPAARRRRRG